MSEQDRPNVYTEEWQRAMEHKGFGVRGTRVGAQAGTTQIGIAVYELDPGKKNLPYHAHFGIEEAIVVLRGTPTLRSPDGERVLAEGEVVSCPPGRDGAHQLINRSEAVARFLVISSKALADVIEYPDSNRVSAQGGDWGTPEAVAYMLSTEPQLEYFEGEPE
ncbi:MAG TPA: cupin domain-containing protein [Solirubrobacterales bacterium]|nr:cupin domain-containing protein [Solirubrobacterales bacterium]